ncbi:PEP/pyruvate-binding domain-containing protein [Endozoicomonas sp. ALB091]|uniref:PEP/pyruvate-binding domain-containing protein n=1 Tax=Endozoicomonas sp. ALB091 TaxID=3403073 RepID=UPI003BB603A0
MFHVKAHYLGYQNPATNPNIDTRSLNLSDGGSRPARRYINDYDPRGNPAVNNPLAKRLCSSHVSSPFHQANHSPPNREQLGGKGMFLRRMQEIGLSVPPFQCVTAEVMNALEQHPLDTRLLAPYLSGITSEPWVETSLMNIRKYLNALPPSEQTKRNDWLAGLAIFVASNDFYQQVKDSEAAKHIRALRDRISRSQPVIVRSSGINEDNYGDAQAGKYLSEVQGEDDVLRTCLKVMASGYRPELCSGGIPQPMALIIQKCINCKYGGVAMSFQSLQGDNTVRVEYTSGQPRGIVGGQSGNTPHRIDIVRKDCKEGAYNAQYIRGTISSHFILDKNTDNNGYSETAIDTDAQSDGDGYRLSDDQIEQLMQAVTKLEDLLLCPVDVEFAIDHQGRLFLLQVRPITRLPGGMEFAMPIPKETLASGEGVSEGYCTGSLWLANKQATDTMPEGAIVVAQHAEEWMLEPEFLKRVGGFAVAAGGRNDHVGIFLRQKKIPLMVAGGQYPAVVAQVGQQATLACARFNGKPGAFVVTGDLSRKLVSYGSLSSAFSDVPLARDIPSWEDLSLPEGTFSQVASGFHWLSDQNARLLALFAPGGGLDCLAHPIKLSMSPQRAHLVAETRDSVNRLIHGAEALLDGYRAFLLLAGDSSSDRVKSLLAESLLLITRFETLKQTITSTVNTIIHPLHAVETSLPPVGRFRQWVSACHQLQSSLEALNPSEAEQVRSVHELIFALHKRFVEALGSVTVDSGQGRLSNERCITYVDCTTPGGSAVKTPLLNPSCKQLLNDIGKSGTVVSMDDALIVNLVLGSHVCVIELLEHAEGGKGRILRLKVSDSFKKPDGSDKLGKLKRMWFLAQLLKAVELDKDADGIKLSCNAVAGEIIVECPRMKLRSTMQEAFEKLLSVLCGMSNLDLHLKDRPIVEGDQWNFNFLAQRLNNDFSEEANRFAFNHCLFLLVYDSLYKISSYSSLLSKYHQQFIDHAQELKWLVIKSDDQLQKMFASDKIDLDTRRKLLHHLLLLSNCKNATQLVDLVYDDLKDQYYIIEPSCWSYRLAFQVPPGQPLPGHKEKIRSALLEQGLQYASRRVRNDKDLVLPTIAKHPNDLQYVSRGLKNDRDVVMAAVTQQGKQLEYASPDLQDNVDVVRAAVAQCSDALRHASERIRSDKSIIETLIADDIGVLFHVKEELLKDRNYLLGLIGHNPYAFVSGGRWLGDDPAFIASAIDANPGVWEYIPSTMKTELESARSQHKSQTESLQTKAAGVRSSDSDVCSSVKSRAFTNTGCFSIVNLFDPLIMTVAHSVPPHVLNVSLTDDGFVHHRLQASACPVESFPAVVLPDFFRSQNHPSSQ